MIPLNFLQFPYRKKHPFIEKKGSWLFNEVLIFSVTYTEGNSHTCMHVFEGGSYLKPADYMLTTSECSINECCSDVSVIFSTAVVILACPENPWCSGAPLRLFEHLKNCSLFLSPFFPLSHPCLLSDLCCSFSHPSLSLICSLSLWSWHLQGPQSHRCSWKASLVVMHKTKIRTFYCLVGWIDYRLTNVFSWVCEISKS